MSSTVRDYALYYVCMCVLGVFIVAQIHGVLLWSAAPITCTHVLRVCGCVPLFSFFFLFIRANGKCNQTVSMQQ